MMNAMRMMMLVCMALLLSACGGGELDDYGCRSDADCKHGRICVDGDCQDQGQGCRDDEDCPAGQHCYDLSCTVCDADADGTFGDQCAGGDCDDDNPFVRPEADELCGDGLDNDCDGATDPSKLCDGLCADVQCADGYACDPETGACVPLCTPDCQGAECGPDGCGQSCGDCPPGLACDRHGQCVVSCEDRCDRGSTECVGPELVTCEDTDNDGCVEWSQPRPCPQRQSCSDGICVECRPDCDDRECGDDGCGGSCGTCPEWLFCDQGWCVEECSDQCWWGESYCMDEFSWAECGDFDQDPCTEFGPRQPCEQGQRCDDWTGRCTGECWDECSWGESYCWSEFEYVECGDWNGDGCLEFGEPMFCEEGWCNWETGRCGGECWDECWWGETYCISEFEYIECGEWDGDWCLEFGPPTWCPEGFCDWDTGTCGGECQDECYNWGESMCWSQWEYVECGDWDDDWCMEYSPPFPCPEGDCDFATGRCGGSCWDECYWGESYCIDDWTNVSCGNYDSDPCLELGPPTPCWDMPCDWNSGQCGGCWDECFWGESYCIDDWAFVECGDWNGDGCMEFGPPTECWNEPCDWDSGRCGGGCWDECSYWGESFCWSEWEVVECGDWDGDSCLEFGPPMPCPEGFCDWGTGQCGGGCWDECFWGESFCWDDFSTVECGDWDADWCLEFGPPMPCPDGFCDWGTGRCGGGCWDECWWGEFYCLTEGSYQACGQYDSDPCADWSPEERCPADAPYCSEQVQGCTPESCWDECMPGERYCWDSWSWVECGQYDADPCFEMSPPIWCPPEAPCDWMTGTCGTCQPLTCLELGRQCDWWDNGCSEMIYCGDCPPNSVCDNAGQCREEGSREGAGQPCGTFNGCLADWSAAWLCLEYQNSTDGVCSYPCDSDSDCAVDFPDGCCRELEPGHRVCMPDQGMCTAGGSGYLDLCAWGGSQSCLPDMFCIEDYLTGGNEQRCLFTCDRAMGICPMGGNCMEIDTGSDTGVCLPVGDGGFADVCSLIDGCVSGLVCLPLNETHPGYCNTMCSDWFPCPNGFDCVLQDGEGGMWCAELCSDQSECDRLGAWECVFDWGPGTGVCLPMATP